MEWNNLNEKVEELFSKLRAGEVKSPEDLKLRELADKIADDHYLEEKIRQQNSYDYQKAFQRLISTSRIINIRRFCRIAVVIFIPLALGIFIFLQMKTEPSVPEINYSDWADIQPGEHRAFLKMHNGREMKLSKDAMQLQETNGIKINIDSTGLHYNKNEIPTNGHLIYNTLIVPRGGEYFLTLSDGTKVWLNADTEMKYPVTFGKTAREVSIKGEAYFAVTKATDRPFIVKTELGEIKVLGTEFNIRSYAGNDKLVTTLVNGKIACTLPQGREIILEPNQQLIAGKDRTTEIREVDTRFTTGWKDGMFQFRDERLEDIMEQLSRWYDIGIFYTCEPVKNLHFSGDLSRFKSIDTFVEMFEKSSDIKITLNGKTLLIGL